MGSCFKKRFYLGLGDSFLCGDNEKSRLREVNQAQTGGLRFATREVGPSNKANLYSKTEFLEALDCKSKEVITHSCPPTDTLVKCAITYSCAWQCWCWREWLNKEWQAVWNMKPEIEQNVYWTVNGQQMEMQTARWHIPSNIKQKYINITSALFCVIIMFSFCSIGCLHQIYACLWKPVRMKCYCQGGLCDKRCLGLWRKAGI